MTLVRRMAPDLWKKSMKMIQRHAPVSLRVKVGTVGFLAHFLSTAVHLEVRRVVLLLFPAVTLGAPVLMWAAVAVSLDEVLRFPGRALLLFVIGEMRLAAKVLPVMCVNALVPLMVSV